MGISEVFSGYNDLHRQFLNDFMDSNGKDTHTLLVYADYLEENGNPLGKAIRLAVNGERDHEGYHRVVHALQGAINMHGRMFKHYHPDNEEWHYVASFNLNNNANPYARSRAERSRYWRVDVPAGGWMYRFHPQSMRIQTFSRPERRKPGEQLKNRFIFNYSIGHGDNEFGPQHFTDVKFSQLPDKVAVYFFLIYLTELYWRKVEI